jgi:hypothetical protein
MKKMLVAVSFLVSLFCHSAQSVEIKIDLVFPKTETAKVTAPKQRTAPQQISGTVSFDIVPCPVVAEKGRYLVEYFLDDIKMYETDGYTMDSSTSSFHYLLDTTTIANGRHQLVVNYWDANGPSAIAIKNICIQN